MSSASAEPQPGVTPADADTDFGRGTWPFLSVWLPSLATVVGSGIAMFSISWWVTRTPDGGASLGLIVGVSSVISLVGTAVLAGVVDRSDRHRAVLVQLLIMVVPLVAMFAVFDHRGGLVVLAGGLCYAVILTLQTLYMGTLESVGADLAPTSWPGPRVALLTQLHTQLSRVVAPAVCGGVIAAGALGKVSGISLALVSAALLVALVFRRPFDVVTARHHSSTLVAPTAETTSSLRRTLTDAISSIRLIRSHRELVFLVWLGVLANLVVSPFYSVLPAFITEYGLAEHDQAILYRNAASSYGIGLLAGSLLLMRYRRRNLGMATLAFAVICCLLITVTVTAESWLLVTAMTLNGALFSVLVAVGGAAWLAHTPPAVRMRVFSLRRLLVFSSIPVGNVLMGVGGSFFGYRNFIRMLLLVVLSGLAVVWVWFRRHRSLDRSRGSASVSGNREAS
jgi:hypothetical protein